MHGRGHGGRKPLERVWGAGNRGGEHRSSALWGTGNRGGEHRSLGRRGLGVVAAAAVALALPLSAGAGDHKPSYVAPGVLQAAGKANGKKLDVVIQAEPGAELSKKAINALGSVKKEFKQLGMVTAEIPANKVEKLRDVPGLIVTLDTPVHTTGYSSSQLWPSSNGLTEALAGGADVRACHAGHRDRRLGDRDGQRLVREPRDRAADVRSREQRQRTRLARPRHLRRAASPQARHRATPAPPPPRRSSTST